MATKADLKQMTQGWAIVEEDLEELEALKHELQAKADKAHGDGRTFMMQEYIRLIATVSPQITRIRNRFEREALASFRKQHKDLKATAKDAQAQQDA